MFRLPPCFVWVLNRRIVLFSDPFTYHCKACRTFQHLSPALSSPMSLTDATNRRKIRRISILALSFDPVCKSDRYGLAKTFSCYRIKPPNRFFARVFHMSHYNAFEKARRSAFVTRMMAYGIRPCWSSVPTMVDLRTACVKHGRLKHPSSAGCAHKRPWFILRC